MNFREIRMKFFPVIAGTLLCIGAFALFSDNEFHLILSLCKYFNVGFIVFVEDGITHRVLQALKRSSDYRIAAAVVSSEQLMKILNDSFSHTFSRQKTLLATKRRIQLGPYLRLVENPKLLVWALFAEPVDKHAIGNDIPYQGELLEIRRIKGDLAVYELLRAPPGTKTIERQFGFVAAGSTDVQFPKQWQHHHSKMNMSNLVLKVGVSSEICESRKDGVLLELIFCSHSKILNMMVEVMNIRKEMVRYPETTYSFVYPNGSYSGYFKMLLEKKVNMSIAAFVVTKKRLMDFDFTWPTFALETMIYLKKADVVKSSLTSSPFSNSVWVVIITWIIVVGSTVYLANLNDCKREASRAARYRFLSLSILKTMQLLCNQGSSDVPNSSAGRILHSTALFTGMLLYFYYSAVVLSFLTVENIDMPFTDFEGFIKNGKYKIIATKGGFSNYFMKFEMNKFRMKAETFMVRTERLPTGIDDCVNQLCKKQFIALLELKGSLLNLKKSQCELTEVPSPVFTQFFGFAFVKGFPFTEHFETMLWRLYEVGLIVRMKQNLSRFDDIKALHMDTDYNAVALEKIVNALIILNLGFLLSFAVLTLEFWQSRRKTRLGGLQRRRERHKMIHFRNH